MNITRHAVITLLVFAVAGSAGAGGSNPLLTLTSVDAYASSSGARGIEARGTFNFEDVVEGTFPAGVVVYQGSHFVRFDQAGAVVEGTAALLADGLDAAEVPALVATGGTPAPPPATLAQLRTDRVTVVLPGTFIAGAASVALYATYEGEGYASNVLTVTLP